MLAFVTSTVALVAPLPLAPVSSRAAVVMQQFDRGGRAPLPIDADRRGRSPGLQNNFYDSPTSDFKRPMFGPGDAGFDRMRDGRRDGRRDREFDRERGPRSRDPDRMLRDRRRGGDRRIRQRRPVGRRFDDRRMGERGFRNQRGPFRDGYGTDFGFDGRAGRVADRVLGPRRERNFGDFDGFEGGRGGALARFGGSGDFVPDFDPRSRGDRDFDSRRGPMRDRYYGDEYFFNDDRPGYLAVRDLLGGVRNAFGNVGISPPWFDAAIGCFLYFALQAAFKEVHPFKTVAANEATARVLGISAFALIQDLAFLPAFRWLRLDAPRGTNPWNGITAAFAFAVPFAAIVANAAWLPKARPFPGADGVFLNLLAAPISEELFFRAYLPTAFMAAGGGETGALIASTVLFALNHVPAAGSAGSSLFIAYLALGAYLNFLYQRSGGSLPLVVITHATLRLIELGGGRMLPF